jgi:predicted dehydrogenase
VKVPENVDDIEASFVTVGAIALQGVRQADPKLGENVAVIGLGLIGQLTVQILKANGCRVIGTDMDPWKLDLAKELGANEVCLPDEIVERAIAFSEGYGVDSVIITASTDSEKPIVDAGEMCRMRGRVVVVGMVNMNIPRNLYYKKELEVKLSMAYGPGRYDPVYEEKGIDYPYDLVRWTEQRNFKAFLNLVAEGKVTPKKLVTHTFSFSEALEAYKLLEGKKKERYLGIVLLYDGRKEDKKKKLIRISEKIIKEDKVSVGLIGAGNFTKSVILPTLKKIKEIELTGLATATGVSAYSAGKKYGFKYITTDAEEIFKNPEINAVIITTRHNDHARKVLLAIKHGKHCFVEKPLAVKEEELEEIREVYKGERVLQVGFNRRFSPLIQEMKKLIQNRPVAIIYRINAGIIPLESWIQDPEVGGGRIIGEVCHFVDTCSYLTGSLVKSVYASVVRKPEKHIPDEDNVSIVLNFENGSIATINYFAYGDNALEKEYIEVFGEGFVLQLVDFKELRIYKQGKKKAKKLLNQDKGFVNEFKAFVEGIKTGKNPIPFESLYNTTKTTFKILESIRTKKVVEVPC